MRMKIFFLTAACLLFASATALAFGRIAYPDRPLNLRAARSPKAKWVGALYPGQKVRIGLEKDGWVAVFEPGETREDERAAVGFSNAKYLMDKRTRYEPESWGEYVSVVRNLNIRNKPNVKGRRLDMLKAGEVVKIDFPDGDWTLVFRPDVTIRSDMNGIGYASAKYFKPAKAPAPAAAPAPAPHQAKVSPVVEAGSGKGQVSSKVAPPPATGPKIVVSDLPEAVAAPPAPPAESGPEPAPAPAESVRAPEAAHAAPAPAPAPAVAPAPEPAAVPEAAARKPRAEDTVTESGRKTIVIDRSRFAGTKRADPTPDQTAHGFSYRLLEKSETRKYGVSWITLKVFLATKVLPKGEALKDFATTLWKENRRATKNVAVLIYLPGMDTGDLSYAVIQFDDSRLLEYWVRRTTLFGTKFM